MNGEIIILFNRGKDHRDEFETFDQDATMFLSWIDFDLSESKVVI